MRKEWEITRRRCLREQRARGRAGILPGAYSVGRTFFSRKTRILLRACRVEYAARRVEYPPYPAHVLSQSQRFILQYFAQCSSGAKDRGGKSRKYRALFCRPFLCQNERLLFGRKMLGRKKPRYPGNSGANDREGRKVRCATRARSGAETVSVNSASCAATSDALCFVTRGVFPL